MDFETLAAAYTPLLMWYALRVLQNKWAAEEVVQETLIAVWRRLPLINRAGNPKAYLRAMLWHRAADYLRREARQRRWEAPLEAAATRVHPTTTDEMALDIITCQQWAVAISALTPAYRDCVELRLTGAKYHEIAQTLRIPVGTVKSRMSYARVKLLKVG